MNQKEYELIAGVFKERLDWQYPDSDKWLAIRKTAQYMASAFETTYPNFDRAKFLEACGLATHKPEAL